MAHEDLPRIGDADWGDSDRGGADRGDTDTGSADPGTPSIERADPDTPSLGSADPDSVREFVSLDVEEGRNAGRRKRRREPEREPKEDIRWERPKRLVVRRVLIATLSTGLVLAIVMLHLSQRNSGVLTVFGSINEGPIQFDVAERVVISVMGIAWIVHAAMVVMLLAAPGGRKTAAGIQVTLLVAWVAFLAFASGTHSGFVTALLLPLLWIVAPLALIDGLADRPSWKSFWGDVFE